MTTHPNILILNKLCREREEALNREFAVYQKDAIVPPAPWDEPVGDELLVETETKCS